ncbi:hypothetical protein M0Q50_03470 [bacterium]|jgi:hypothetical protein|nr:hypothetical protein [bacterium]
MFIKKYINFITEEARFCSIEELKNAVIDYIKNGTHFPEVSINVKKEGDSVIITRKYIADNTWNIDEQSIMKKLKDEKRNFDKNFAHFKGFANKQMIDSQHIEMPSIRISSTAELIKNDNSKIIKYTDTGFETINQSSDLDTVKIVVRIDVKNPKRNKQKKKK